MWSIDANEKGFPSRRAVYHFRHSVSLSLLQLQERSHRSIFCSSAILGPREVFPMGYSVILTYLEVLILVLLAFLRKFFLVVVVVRDVKH